MADSVSKEGRLGDLCVKRLRGLSVSLKTVGLLRSLDSLQTTRLRRPPGELPRGVLFVMSVS